MEVTLDKVKKALDLYNQCNDATGDSDTQTIFSEAGKTALENILSAQHRVSPMVINELDTNEVFVFGCDLKGTHIGRAAELAVEAFHGAKPEDADVWEGPYGEAYAIPTTNKKGKDDHALRTRKLEEVLQSIERFIAYAGSHPELTFYVTRVGSGNAGFTDEEIAPMFRAALMLSNVYLPQSFLNELFQLKPEFENPSLMVPSTSTDVKTFRQELDMQLSLYQTWLRQHYNFAGPTLPIIDSVERLSFCISKAVDLMYRGLPSQAYLALKEGLEQKETDKDKWVLKLSNIAPHQTLYRMRKEDDNWAKKKIDSRGMFHIPYSLRGIVSTQRYSVPGFPSLYLGRHIFGCWEELGRPNLSNCVVSKLQNTHEFQVVDVTVPLPSTWYQDASLHVLKDMQDISEQIILFPLIIACTFRTSDPKATFKPEYIIPQLLLQYVKERAYEATRQNKKEGRDVTAIYGIKYTSVNLPKPIQAEPDQDDLVKAEFEQYENYVIPVINIKNEHCSVLCNLFKVTDPICEEYDLLDTHSAEKVSKFQQMEKILSTRMLTDI